MAGRFAGWRALTGPEKRLFVGLLVGLPLVAASLRMFGMVRTGNLLRRISGDAGARSPETTDMLAAERLAELTATAGRRGPIAITCLRQALLVEYVLRRRGFAPELKIGVRKQEGAFDAHAWVELQGIPLGQAELAHRALLRTSGQTRLAGGEWNG